MGFVQNQYGLFGGRDGPRTSPPVGARALLCPGYSAVSEAGPMAEASTPAFGNEITPSSVSMVV